MITVYHGSNVEVPKPSLSYGRTDTDFGSGFYVTENYEMAEKWACRRNIAVINEYELDTSGLNIYNFGLDKEWLDFVVSNRNENLTNIDIGSYDLITGATADDKLFSTLEQYENGFISPETAVKILNCMKVGTQICIKTQKGLNSLHYIGREIPSREQIEVVQRQNREERKLANARTKEILQQNN